MVGGVLIAGVRLWVGLSNCFSKVLVYLFMNPQFDRLAGLVVKASASRAEGPGFESRLRRDFFGVESYQ